MEDNIDITRHLLEVESEAAGLVDEAQKKADSKISAARAEAESLFKKEYSQFIEILEKEEENKKKSFFDEHEKIIQEYKQSLENREKDSISFAALMDKLLSA